MSRQPSHVCDAAGLESASGPTARADCGEAASLPKAPAPNAGADALEDGSMPKGRCAGLEVARAPLFPKGPAHAHSIPTQSFRLVISVCICLGFEEAE